MRITEFGRKNIRILYHNDLELELFEKMIERGVNIVIDGVFVDIILRPEIDNLNCSKDFKNAIKKVNHQLLEQGPHEASS